MGSVMNEFFSVFKLFFMLLINAKCKDKFNFKFYAIKFRDYNIILRNDHFDFFYYECSSNLKFKRTEDAIVHYIAIGENKNIDPCFKFSRFRYLCHNPDLKNMKMMPFTHFILYADKENRHY